MPQLVLDFPQELMDIIDFRSKERHKKPEIFISNIIKEYLEDLEDYDEVVKVSREIAEGRMKTFSWEEVKMDLGLAD